MERKSGKGPALRHGKDAALKKYDETQAPQWYLEGLADDRQVLRRIPIKPVPFMVGRKPDLPLTLNFSNTSRLHAEIYFEDSTPMVRDLDSRNGTYVNREKIHRPTVLRSGDIVHFGNCEFRVGMEMVVKRSDISDTVEISGMLSAQFVTGVQEFMEMIRNQAVAPAFQPLVRLADRSVFGYEILGRGSQPGLWDEPGELFRIASSVGLEPELSRLFRIKGAEAAHDLPGARSLFMNVHPVEMSRPDILLESLQLIRDKLPDHKLTLEVHEGLVTDLGPMRELRSSLGGLGISLAYDDFGAGQARLMELAEVPPDYLKFDISLIHAIHEAPPQRQQMVEVLVKYARDLGVVTLAEGVEREEEADTCLRLGFETAQGYFFGKPVIAKEMKGG